MDTLEGIIEDPPRKFDSGFVIFTVRAGQRLFKVTGDDPGVHEADVVKCEGQWTEYRGERQFKAKQIIPQIPTSADAIIDYLASGRIKGIKEAYAKKLVDAFGKDVLTIIEREPERLKEVKGFGPAKIKAVVDGVRDQIGFRSILIFLHSFGLSKRLVNKIYEMYGVNAVEQIQKNPYALAQEIDGIGFVVADKIGRQAGLAADDPHRIMAGLSHALNDTVNKTGSTGITHGDLSTNVFNLFSKSGANVEHQKITEGIEVFVGSPFAKVIPVNDVPHIFPTYLHDAEVGIANHLVRIIKGFKTRRAKNADAQIKSAQKNLGIKELADAQHDAVKMALLNGVCVITGGPGTGKTTIVRLMLEVLKTEYGIRSEDILLCAPTGKAAIRLFESSGMEAQTLHRALSFSPETGGFLQNENEPFEQKVILVDESSMVDTQLCHWFIQAVRTGSQLIIVGDDDQLASVGPGKVLKDLLDSGVIPVTKLTEIYRQAKGSRIIVNSHMINKGQVPDMNNRGELNDYWFIRQKKDSDIANSILDLVGRVSNYFKYDPIEDMQVLTAKRDGILGIYELNTRLQKLLNPNLGSGIKITQDKHDVEFCVKDKVQHIENNYTMGVMNGEVGRIVSVDVKAKKLVVRYDARLVEYTFQDLNQLRLSYAMTIHKSQGSEYPCVIMPFTTSHFVLLSRNLYYTGQTRTKKTFVGVGDVRALEIAVKVSSLDQRVTGLKEHLRKALEPIDKQAA